MKILALSAGSTGGNTELIVLTALKAVKTAHPEASVQLVRLEEVKIGSKLIAGQFRHPFAKERKLPGSDEGPDDRAEVLNAIMDADALLIGAPVLNRGCAGLLKWFTDKTLGPFQDISVAKEMTAMGKGQMVDQRIFKPKVAALISVGGALSSDWTTFGLPMMHQMLFPMTIPVIDQIQVHGAGLPGCVILDAEAIARAEELGRNLASAVQAPVESRKYVGKQGNCPVCNLNVIKVLEANNVECATCAAKGTLEIVNGNIVTHFKPAGLEESVFRIEALTTHGTEIKEVAARLKPQMVDVPERAKSLLTWGEEITLTPSSLASQSASAS